MEILESVVCLSLRPWWITPSSICIILHKILSLNHKSRIILLKHTIMYKLGIAGCKDSQFRASHSGKLYLACTSPKVISISPPPPPQKRKLTSRIDCNSSVIEFPPKKILCPSGKLRTEFSGLTAKSTSPRVSDTTFFTCWHCNLT